MNAPFRARDRAAVRDIERELRQRGREIEARWQPAPRPLIVSRADLEISAAEQRCIASLERSNRLAASKGNL